MNAPYDPRAVANKLLDIADVLAGEAMPITPLALQKLLFFVHARYLKESGGIPAVRGAFEAWQYGPVHPAVYKAFSGYGRDPITSRVEGKNVVTGQPLPLEMPNDPMLQKIIGQVLISFGNLPASALVRLSHQVGGAWDTIWKKIQLGDAITRQIPDSVTLSCGRSMFVVTANDESSESTHVEDEDLPPEYRNSNFGRTRTWGET
ncbi:DUF4065 domain-containing protein [Acetobacter sp. LMG 1627]|uniref:DUF4065 domain-containing protein n=2 Tax=Acetobacter conturbans TaxID=1737472 RepID=A0ABX0K1Z8_9PROT|nr:DUF4065 domain-containing protein [Acetobacter conturbans]